MATNFNPVTKVSVLGPLNISDKRSADMPLDIRGRIETLTDITTIPFAWEGMLVYVRDTKKYYKVTSLANRTVAGVTIPYYPATWVEFGSGGSTPSPTPSDIDAGDVSYVSSGTFSNRTVGKELQSLANDILGLAEDIHNLSGDIGTLSNLNTENKQDLVAAINEVLASTGSTIAVVDNLVSNSTTDALSAYQGKVLKGLVDGKVTGIKVQGESSVLPMDSNGIVTIPAGGGGSTGTITGATVGGAQVPEVSGILQFQAYPTVPIISIETSDHTTLTPNNGLITLPAIPADQSTRIKNIENSIAQMGNNQPIVIPSSAVELPVSTSDPDYIDYDSDTTYVMNIDGTQVATIHYPYVDNNNNYVAFKAIDRDLYYVYSVSVVNDAERYTYSNQYTWSTLPADAKSKFESGIYAIKQVIKDDGTLPEKKWYKNIPSVFVDENNLPLRSRRINETISSSVIDVVLVKNDRLNKIYRYAFNVSHNTWVLINGGCYTKDDATTGENYIKYDAYFDRQPASNVSFDDNITHLGTQENPVDNVQLAIQALSTNINSLLCTLTIQLYKDSSLFSGKEIDVTIKHAGEINTTLSGTYTTVNGIVTLSVPLGNTYTIEFSSEANYITPSTIEGIADSLTKTISVIYNPISENEREILICLVRNSSNLPTGKVAYIDYMNSDYSEELSHEEFTITFDSNGKAATIVNKTHGTVSYCDIPFGTYYRVRLADWDTSEEQVFVPSSPYLGRATKDTNVINLRYTYSLSGLFLVVKDTYDSTFGYSSYLVTGINSENNMITIKIGSSNYDIKYQAGTGILKSPSGEDNYTTWYASADIDSNIIGIGVRNQTLINSPLLDADGTAQNYTNCCVMVCKGITAIQKAWITKSILDNYDGKYGTNNTAADETVSPAARDTKAITKVTGNHTQTAFIPSNYQAKAILYNIDDINVIASCINMSMPTIKTGIWWTSSDWSSSGSGEIDVWTDGQYGGNYTKGNLYTLNNILPVFCFN